MSPPFIDELPPRPAVVVLCGYQEHGKTTGARWLTQLAGFRRVSFADPIRAMLVAQGCESFRFDPKWKDVAGLVGLWVAVGGSGIEHAARLDYVCVEFTDKALRAHPEIGPFVRDAVKSWPEFVEHMQEVDVLLSRRKPKLWLTTTEVA